jgi:hypothetical protein
MAPLFASRNPRRGFVHFNFNSRRLYISLATSFGPQASWSNELMSSQRLIGFHRVATELGHHLIDRRPAGTMQAEGGSPPRGSQSHPGHCDTQPPQAIWPRRIENIRAAPI